MDGIKTRPIFDNDFYHVGEVISVTIEPIVKFDYWQTQPQSPFNAIILDVTPEKLIIGYYTPRNKKLFGRFAIPVDSVVNASIIIRKVE